MFYHVQITVKEALPPHRFIEEEFNLNLEQTERRFLIPHRREKPMFIRGRTIASDELHRIRIYQSKSKITDSKFGLNRMVNRGVVTDVTNDLIADMLGWESESATNDERKSKAGTEIQVFVSHSSDDLLIARKLIHLLQNSLNLSDTEIRCTSLDGYRMQPGAAVDDTLREEVHESALLIGLITPSSINSAYVIFELGARWGSGKPFIPLLAAGITPEDLKGPLKGINALDAREEGQVHHLVEEAVRQLNIRANNASSYIAAIKELVEASSESYESQGRHEQITVAQDLSEEAKELLTEAASDPQGLILYVRSFAGSSIQTNGKEFGVADSRRSTARWEQAMKDLITLELIEDPVGKGQVFEVTNLGFETSDEIST